MSRMVVETCDTSVLVPALLSWHERHDDARRAVHGVRGVPAHVLVESYSVLTRLPAPSRLAPAAAADLLARLPGPLLALSGERYADMLVRLAAAGVKAAPSTTGWWAPQRWHTHGYCSAWTGVRYRPTRPWEPGSARSDCRMPLGRLRGPAAGSRVTAAA